MINTFFNASIDSSTDFMVIDLANQSGGSMKVIYDGQKPNQSMNTLLSIETNQ